MDIELEFLDERGRPLVFPEWPGGMHQWVKEMPRVSGLAQHRLVFTSSYLSTFDISLSMNDSIQQLKEYLTIAVPHLYGHLAVGREIARITYLGEELSDEQQLNSHRVKVVKRDGSHFQFEGQKDCLQVVTRAVTRILNTRTDKMIVTSYNEFDPITITTADVMKELLNDPSVTHSQSLVRFYTSAPPQLCRPKQRLFGFKGRKEKGIWLEKPYRGPLQPCGLTTPPALELRLLEKDAVACFEKEEDWWGLIKQQSGWVGHQETYCGEKEPVTMLIRNALPPTWVTLQAHGTNDKPRCHVLWKKKVHLPSPEGFVQASVPISCSVTNQAAFHDDVEVTLVDDGMMLPTPKEIAQEGLSYWKSEIHTSFGKGQVKSGLGGNPLPMIFKMQVKENNTVHLVVCSHDSQHKLDDQTPEHVYEGELATGLTQSQYFRGVHYFRWPKDNGDVMETRRLPFCLFQLTTSGTVPDVLTSALGQRLSGLKDRAYTIICPHITDKVAVGYRNQFVKRDAFLQLLPNKPSIVLALLAFLVDGVHVNAKVCILWFINSGEDLFLPVPEANRVKEGCDYVIRAKSAEDIDASFSELGDFYGVGLDPASLKQKRPSFAPGKLQDIPKSDELVSSPSSPKTLPKTRSWSISADGKWVSQKQPKDESKGTTTSSIAEEPEQQTSQVVTTTTSSIISTTSIHEQKSKKEMLKLSKQESKRIKKEEKGRKKSERKQRKEQKQQKKIEMKANVEDEVNVQNPVTADELLTVLERKTSEDITPPSTTSTTATTSTSTTSSTAQPNTTSSAPSGGETEKKKNKKKKKFGLFGRKTK
eukprot:m.91897 g.91897  ORF g.91897 m.91897 type:complete len:816 (+) comp12341_c0_seq1:80-2527(+)